MSLRSFVIGSSFPVVFHFLLSVRMMDSNKKNYSYQNYSLLAPLYLGLMNMLGEYLFMGENRYLYTGLLSGFGVCLIATLMKSYNYTWREWINYYIYIMFKHFITFVLIVQTLDKYF